VFTTLVLMTGITSAIPYGFSALAQLKWRLMDYRAMHTRPRTGCTLSRLSSSPPSDNTRPLAL
jgi:hypothetical protein